jgi:hypothetical protein
MIKAEFLKSPVGASELAGPKATSSLPFAGCVIPKAE